MGKARAWTAEEDEILRSMYLTHERTEIGAVLGRSKGSIRKRCSVLGLNFKNPAVTDEERQRIKEWYLANEDTPVEEFGLNALAAELGRTRNLVCRLAGQMGLTDRKREYGEERRKQISENTKRFIREKGHPRGMLGKKHSAEFSKAQSERVKARVFTPEQKEAIVEKMMRTKVERYGTGNPGWAENSNPYSRTKSGKRADLNNQFFRSSWEANYARYLNWLIEHGEIKSWEFECHTFTFPGITRGTISYTPDFKVYENDGSYSWHEVKGWMDNKSKTRLKRMAKYFPDEKIVLIDRKAYREIAKIKAMISNWEDGSV